TFSGTDADGYLQVNPDGSIELVSAIPASGVNDGATRDSIVLPVTVTDGINEPVTVDCEIRTEGVIWTAGVVRIYASRAPGYVVWEPGPDFVYADVQTWTIASGNEAGYFAIDPSTGVVTVASNLPRPEPQAMGVSELPGPDGQTDRQVDYPLEIEITIPEGVIPGTLTVRTVDFFDDDHNANNESTTSYEDSINWLGDPAVAPWLRPITSGCNGATKDPPEEAPVYCPTINENNIDKNGASPGHTRRWHMAVFVTRMAMVVAEPPAAPNPPLSVLTDAGWADSIIHPRARWVAAMLVSSFSDGCGLPLNTFNGRAVGTGFCPDDPITWGQASAFIRRAFGPAIDGSTGLGLSQEIPALEWLIEVGATGDLLSGDQPDGGDADETVPRDVMARVLETTWGLTGG
ncbi:MAG: cadherin repeat domain-containing protein, partial [Acidimicrobiia bacterium]|nr:cadherin repeat domain-containing protein [Acidimicrobiia bacterium]